MLGKMIGALVGGKLAKQTKGMGGTTGAIIGAAAPVVLRRMSIPAMIAMGVGGYAVKKFLDKKDENAGPPKQTEPKSPGKPVASVPQPSSA